MKKSTVVYIPGDEEVLPPSSKSQFCWRSA